MRRTLEALLVEQCAPTLAGLKPASLFRCQPEEGESLLEEILRLKQELRDTGLELRILKKCQQTGACMLYLYRKRWLEQILSQPQIRSFLAGKGYPAEENCEGFLQRLSRHLCLEQEYPHEIGVFLGYPLEDVVGFIENRGRNFTCCGYWKVYGNPEEARKRFDRYRRCTSVYQKRFRRGAPIAQLVVAA